jgi:hypothetical protein
MMRDGTFCKKRECKRKFAKKESAKQEKFFIRFVGSDRIKKALDRIYPERLI